MKDLLTQLFIRMLPRGIKYRLRNDASRPTKEGNLCFGQNGEDALLQRIFRDRRKGFYVDVGAHHPVRFSNTYRLYLQGWRGINIDAMPGSMRLFNDLRPEDINLEMGISEVETPLDYYVFNEPALNTFSASEARKKDGNNGFFIVRQSKIPTVSLSRVLDQYLPTNTPIDYLNIDAEGLDFQVLKSNNWSKYSPLLITVETNYSTQDVRDRDVYQFLTQVGFNLVSVSLNTLFFSRYDYSPYSFIRI